MSLPWRKVQALADGAFGEVYLADHSSPDGDGAQISIAVKTSRLEDSIFLAKERKIYKKFQNCPEILRCYSHQITSENNAPVYNLLLEYAPAGTLDRVIETAGAISESHVRLYARTILRALTCMDAEDYVHCDVTPENIFAFPSVYRNGAYRVKLANFTEAKEPGEDLEGIFRGTGVDYMAPEVFAGEISPAMDVWSLGCSVVQMIGGSDTPWPKLREVETEEFVRRLVMDSDMTPAIPGNMSVVGQEFLRICLQREPEKRRTAERLLIHPYFRGLRNY